MWRFFKNLVNGREGGQNKRGIGISKNQLIQAMNEKRDMFNIDTQS